MRILFGRKVIILTMIATVTLTGCGGSAGNVAAGLSVDESETIKLPEPSLGSSVSLEESLLNRRSTRSYTGEPLRLREISQMLWAAQGITDETGHRTAPSAVAIYPLSIYLVAGNVPEILPGVYLYEPETHSITRTIDGDIREDLADAAMGQTSVSQGAVSFVVTVDYDKVIARFGDKGERFGTLEAGHAAQNLCLQATALDLGVVTAGAIDDDKVKGVLDLPERLTPLYVIPAGRKP